MTKPTVEVLVLFAHHLDGLLDLLDLAPDAVRLGRLIAALLLPSIDLGLLLGDAPFPLVDRLVELSLTLVQLSVERLRLCQ